MKLDRTTYEAWLIDRIDGTLSPEQERELDAFLLANPDLVADTDGLPGVHRESDHRLDTEWLKRELPPKGLPTVHDLDDHLVARQEGDLRPDQLDALEAFLSKHPERSRDALLIAAARIIAEDHALPQSDKPYRTFPPQGVPDRHRITDFLIGAMEGDLDENTYGAVQQYLKDHPEFEREARLVQATRILAGAEQYPNKEQLKKGGRVVPFWSTVAVRWAAAASVVLLLGLGWVLLRNNDRIRLAEETAPTTRTETNAKNVLETPKELTGTGPEGPTEDPEPSSEKGEVPQPDAGRNVRPVLAPVPVPTRTPPPAVPDRENLAEVPETLPEEVPEEESELAEAAPVPVVPAATVRTGGLTVKELLVSTMRERILDDPTASTEPLDASDAVAAVDRGLASLSGGKAGLSVTEQRGRKRFDLRLGNSLSISASKGL